MFLLSADGGWFRRGSGIVFSFLLVCYYGQCEEPFYCIWLGNNEENLLELVKT